MHCLLVNPPWLTRKGNIWTLIRSTMPPLGILYLAACLEQAGHEVTVVDYQGDPKPWETIEAEIRAWRADLVGITATTPIVKHGYRIAALVKRHHPATPVVFGGVHATALPEEPLATGNVDFVVRGEGEEAILALAGGNVPTTIPGLSLREADGTIHHIGTPGMMANLDALPIPAYHLVDLSRYRPALGAYKRLPGINMATTRGCPGKCTFCNSADIRLRKRSAEHIFAEMAHLARHHGMKEISFYDDTFTVYPNNLIRLCKLLVANGVDLTWSCFARVDCVSEELLTHMKAAGCHQVMYGIESASDDILRTIKKPIPRAKVKEAIAITKQVGITVRCTFMLGNPGETHATVQETIRYANELAPDIALFNITTPYPGTEMFAWAKANGYLLTEDWDDYDLSRPVMRLPTLSPQELEGYYRKAHLAFYLRPGPLWRKATDPASWHSLGRLWEAGVKWIRSSIT
ncbi:anaerobic magnesium-protoporphyrin IX monomethyl ester cyclase [Gammaproteobacteria bacterium]